MTIHEANQRLLFQLYEIYDDREAANIADLVMENITGWRKIDRILNKHVPLLQRSISLLEQYAEQLLGHKPVQYVLNEAWFFGLKFFVNENVLIPRPETEELVEWIVGDVGKASDHKFTVLDIGTGSACIPVTIKKQLPFIEMLACDISKPALEVAQTNALNHKADITFLLLNFLDPVQWNTLPHVDIVVSNPPYIPLKDKENMRANVVRYEPHLALFVDNNDALIFYRAIAEFAVHKLNTEGSIYVEIHEEFAEEVRQLFEEKNFNNIKLKKDLQGKYRMARIKR